MGLFEWFTPEVGAIGEPPGDPGSLRGAARAFSATAEGTEAQLARIRGAAEAVVPSGWFGIAAFAFKAAAGMVVADLQVAPGAFRTAAGGLETLAVRLEAAKDAARRAQAAASELNQASAQLDAKYAEASSSPQGITAIPGLVAQAGALHLEAMGIQSAAADAHQQAEAAAQEAAATFNEVATSAPSVQRAIAAAKAAQAEEGDGEPGGVLGVLYDASKPFRWAGDKVLDGAEWAGGQVVDGASWALGGVADGAEWVLGALGNGAAWVWDQGGQFLSGAWNELSDMAVSIYHLTPFHEGWTEEWGNLWEGLKWCGGNLGECGSKMIGLDVLEEKGVAYWLGTLVPGAVATLTTAGAGAAVKGASATAKVADTAEDLGDLAKIADKFEDAGDVARVIKGADNVEDVDDVVKALDDVGDPAKVQQFANDLENFQDGTAVLKQGPLDDDLVVIQYTDYSNPGSLNWWTTTGQANKMSTIDDVMDDLALLPEWGARDGVRVATIPAGSNVTFLYGKTAKQVSQLTGKVYAGGGEQFRFLDFDEDWIVEFTKVP